MRCDILLPFIWFYVGSTWKVLIPRRQSTNFRGDYPVRKLFLSLWGVQDRDCALWHVLSDTLSSPLRPNPPTLKQVPHCTFTNLVFHENKHFFFAKVFPDTNLFIVINMATLFPWYQSFPFLWCILISSCRMAAEAPAEPVPEGEATEVGQAKKLFVVAVFKKKKTNVSLYRPGSGGGSTTACLYGSHRVPLKNWHLWRFMNLTSKHQELSSF